MEFFALLTKEMRVRMRRERIIWLLIIYILLLGLTGWLVIRGITNNNIGSNMSMTGTYLYYLLGILQLVLIIFITPAFTTSAINGEKMRQTFDLLMCSQLSGFSLVAGKLMAGLSTALLLVGASIPLFSLLFFFGGIAPYQLIFLLFVYVSTILFIGTLGMLCSICFHNSVVSTTIAYLINLLWLISPLFFIFMYFIARHQYPSSQNLVLLSSWSPFVTIFSITDNASTFVIPVLHIEQWLCYTLLSLVAAIILFFVSVVCARPQARVYINNIRREKHGVEKAEVTA
jgi:ABC-type transport system involved in multi-copper enzyme maturation permease subunit